MLVCCVVVGCEKIKFCEDLCGEVLLGSNGHIFQGASEERSVSRECERPFCAWGGMYRKECPDDWRRTLSQLPRDCKL